MVLTDDDRDNIYSIKSEFDNNVVAQALSEQAVNYYQAAAESEKYETYWEIKSAAGYVRHVFHANAFTNDGSLDHWFELPSLGIPELARRQGELRVKWDAEAAAVSDEEYAAIEVELDRVSDLENEGFYGRTVAYSPEMKDWIYIRFGKMPKAGKSVFGLIREDNEDGVDPWRQELGNMTHEAGVCVFKAYRHPDVPDAFILIEPHFELARYNVSNSQEHLLAIIPESESISDIPVLRIRGDLATIHGRDKTLRADLGSDGEYLINSQKPFEIEEIDIARIWASQSVSVTDLLHRYRRFDSDGGAKAMIEKTITLYHGTTPESAELLIKNGWQPNSFGAGSQCGQSRYLYLTTHPQDALWFANEKGSETVLELKDIPYSLLKVDPEDGMGETIDEEVGSLHGLPGKVVLTKAVEGSVFELHEAYKPSIR